MILLGSVLIVGLASIGVAVHLRFDRMRAELAAAEAEKCSLENDLERERQTFAELGPIFDNAPHWTPDDAIALAGFLKTDSGRTLARRFQVVAGNQAVAGCRDVMHTTYAAGNGNGWDEACRWFLQLSRVTGVQVAKNDESAPEGETQLLERLSP
jgi:hypothetical protein